MGEKTDAGKEFKALCEEFAIDIPPNYEATAFAQSLLCIYNVPPTIRAINPSAYTPRVISIGPIHNAKEELREMEVQKLWYLEEFCNRPRKSGKGKDKEPALVVKDLKRLIERNIAKIKHSYPASATSYPKWSDEKLISATSYPKWSDEKLISATSYPKWSDEKLMRMILLDSIFILELFLRLEFGVEDDPILSTPWLKCAVQRDLVLLENQLPFFILDELYEFAIKNLKQNLDQLFLASFFDLTLHYFTDSKYVTNEKSMEGSCSEIAHFTDLVRYSWCLDHPQKESGGDNSSNKNINNEINNEFSNWYSVTKLNRSGVKFRKSSTPHLLKVEFGDPGWFRKKLLPKCMKHVFSLVFEVPQLKIDDGTECLFRNLMALEQCRYPKESYICDYVMLLDSLIDTEEDVDHLTDKSIILNMLGDDVAVKQMVNILGLGIVQGNSSFGPICKRLNNYCESNWNRDIAFLKSVYFKNVWIGTGTVFAVIVLLLTLANTVRLFATSNY